MRTVITVSAALLGAVVLFFGIIIAASESGEVVILTTTDAQGRSHTTRLWAVDHAGAEWVRTGHPEKGWFAETVANPRVEFERGGSKSSRVAVPVREPEIAREVNAKFATKYGDANWIVALSGSAERRVVVRLDPIPVAER